MNNIRKYITDYCENNRSFRKDDLYLLETSLYLEDSFGIRLADDQICPEILNNADTIEKFIREKITSKKGKKGL
ncbi:MAG: hypothetical protein JW881_03310 [Spirochaetales bacterium]|nr:hypothetical protein [Spirochaetales bacterium]